MVVVLEQQSLDGCLTLVDLTDNLRNTENPCETDMIFAKMPTEQEISAKETANSLSPIHIFIADSIRIEVMPDCSPELFHLLIKGLKDHA